MTVAQTGQPPSLPWPWALHSLRCGFGCCPHGWAFTSTWGCGTMALDCGRALGAWFRGGPALRLGLRMDGTRYAGAGCSAEETGCGGVLSLRAEPHVPGVLRGLGGAVGSLRTGKPGGDRRII